MRISICRIICRMVIIGVLLTCLVSSIAYSNVAQVRSDLIIGSIINADSVRNIMTVQLRDGSNISVILTQDTDIHFISNLLPGRSDPPTIEAILKGWIGQSVAVSGLIYFDQPAQLYAKELLLLTDGQGGYQFENQDWWRIQAQTIADFWIRAQGLELVAKNPRKIASIKYRTVVTKVGTHRSEKEQRNRLQETATLSRLIYGLSSAYLMNGNQDLLNVASALVAYQQQNMRVDLNAEHVFWIHALDGKKRIIAPLAGDDVGTIPLYEQIYCLAGLTQYYRITQDSKVLADIRKTLSFIDRFYWDKKNLGYFSHIDPTLLEKHKIGPLPSPDQVLNSVPCNNNRKKNWNSIGDHLPAYLMNLYLGTREPIYLKQLESLSTLIANHFPVSDSPFVLERFNEFWAPDLTYSWQQDRGVVGHNLKIVWCLTQMFNLTGDLAFRQVATSIAEKMRAYGEDLHCGGWYDVIQRHPDPTTGRYLHVWHNRKAWWQQEQGILANYILYLTTNNPAYLESARSGAAFYNFAFLDRLDSGTFFDATADGIPFLNDQERVDKGSHSKSAYHDIELTYYANIYVNLLMHGRNINLYFRPKSSTLGQILYVQPVALPVSKVELKEVYINGKQYGTFNKDDLAITLPRSAKPLSIKVVLGPKTLSVTGKETANKKINLISTPWFIGQENLRTEARLPTFQDKLFDSQSVNNVQLLGTVNAHRGRWNPYLSGNDMLHDSFNKGGFVKSIYLHPRGGRNADGIYAIRFTVNHDIGKVYKLDRVRGAPHMVTGEESQSSPSVFFKVTKAMEYTIHFNPETATFSISPEVLFLDQVQSMQINGFVHDKEQGDFETYNRYRTFPCQKWDETQFNHEMSYLGDNIWEKKLFLSKKGGMEKRQDGIYQFLFSANHNGDWGFCAINGQPGKLAEGYGYDSKTGNLIDSDIVIKIVKDDWYTIRINPKEHWFTVYPQVDILNTIKSYQINGPVVANSWDPTDPSHEMDKSENGIWRKTIYLSSDGGPGKNGIYSCNISINNEWLLDSLGFGAWITSDDKDFIRAKIWHIKPQEPNFLFQVTQSGFYNFIFDPVTQTLTISPPVERFIGIKALKLVGDFSNDASKQWNPYLVEGEMTTQDGILFRKEVTLQANQTYQYKYTVNNAGFLWAFGDYIYDGYKELSTHGDPPALEFSPNRSGAYIFEANISTGEYSILPKCQKE